MQVSADIGIVGLGVMGKNLACNFSDHGYRVAIYDRTSEKMMDFIKNHPQKKLLMSRDVRDFVGKLKKPRIVLLMIEAGHPVDDMIAKIIPFFEEGDILIDGGNSHFLDTQRRCEQLREKKIFFVGCGISGGKEGAMHGPSLMFGGNRNAWPHIQQIFFSIAAKARNRQPCCEWLGDGGSGHYVKMAHNAIEYSDMQLIAEIYDLLKRGLEYSIEECRGVFEEWNRTDLQSYLLEITGKILKEKEEDGSYLIEKILDMIQLKNTGAWAVEDALKRNVPLSVASEAVFARFVSQMKDERLRVSEKIKGPKFVFAEDKKHFVHELSHSLYGSRIVILQQGFRLMREASKFYGWHLPLSDIAFIWTEGCIIRSRLLSHMQSSLENVDAIFEDPFFQKELMRLQSGWRNVLVHGILMGIPLPCISSALAYYDGYRSAVLPASLTAAQRDFFGHHGFERKDRRRGEQFYHSWK